VPGPLKRRVWALITAASALTLGLIAAPAAAADGGKPTRMVIQPESAVYPAGEACPSFPVSVVPADDARQTITEFSDGRTVIIGHGKPTDTNLETGTSYTARAQYKVTITTLDSGDLHYDISGIVGIILWAGEQGPFGEVKATTMFIVRGHVEMIVDGGPSGTFFATSFNWNGTLIDLCALLEG
jgi:hypothetical protein